MLYMRKDGELKIYGIGKIGPKGQVVIPSEARKELSLDPGERVVVMSIPHKDGLVVINEEEFNKHLSHMRKRFGRFDDFENEYRKHQKDDCLDA